MSNIKFGAKTNQDKDVSKWTRKKPIATQQNRYSQTFSGPGTWTWPGNVTHVQVLLVGGGGGGSGQMYPPTNPYSWDACGGGGGGVRYEWEVPVTGPVTVTVGAGGAGGVPTGPLKHGSQGGQSSFGPTIAVGGGGGGMHSHPSNAPTGYLYVAAPANGGSPGGIGNKPGTPALIPAPTYVGGTYGAPYHGSNGDDSVMGTGVSGDRCLGLYGYGAGGYAMGWPPNYPSGYSNPTVFKTEYPGQSNLDGGSGAANSGAGGNSYRDFASSSSAGLAGGNGGSGVVIVSWWE